MATYSGIPKIYKWVTAKKPYTWIKTLRDNGLSSFKIWKDVQEDDNKKLVTKNRLVKKLR